MFFLYIFFDVFFDVFLDAYKSNEKHELCRRPLHV